MTKTEAKKTLAKMIKAGNVNAKIVMVSKALLKDFGCVDSTGINYVVKTGYQTYIK